MRALLFLLFFVFCGTSHASTAYYWLKKVEGSNVQQTPEYASADAACMSLIGVPSDSSWWTPVIYQATETRYYCSRRYSSAYCPSCGTEKMGEALRYSRECEFGNTGSQCNTSCESPNVMENGQCVIPSNPCVDKANQATSWKKTWTSFDSYTGMGDTANQGGCQATITTLECGSKSTGEFACWGAATYTGEQDTTSGEVDDCIGVGCSVPDPVTANTDQQCSAPTTSGSTTTYTCVTSSSADEFAGANCSFGTVNGSTGYHCTKPAYVPSSDVKTRTDEVSETVNPDGSKTTTTTSTTNNTYCQAGACTTTTTTTTSTKSTDAAGNTTGETSTCTGVDCDKPEDPKDGQMPGTVPGPSTEDAFPLPGGGEDVPGYEDSVKSFYNRLTNAPIVASVSSLAVPTGGSCSIGSASLFGGSVSFDDFCDMAPQVLAGLRYLFLAIWAWAAVRLFLTA